MIGTRLFVLSFVAVVVIAGVLLTVLDRRFVVLGRGRVEPAADRVEGARSRTADLRYEHEHDVLPRYVDLDAGDTLRVLRVDRPPLDILVRSIEIESRLHHCPRTRVDLESDGKRYAARCGMAASDSGGIAPIAIDGVCVAVEITRLLFSSLPAGSSPFNAYENFRLQGDLRLAVWDSTRGTMRGERGSFVLDQPEWTRNRFGNWLHATGYGIHSAIDVFATRHGAPERVICPVDGTVYKTYRRDADPDDPTQSKVVNVYGNRIVGPNGERILYRFQHLSEISVADGEPVRSGQALGYSGHSGFDPKIGDHLHFEMRLNPSCFGLERDDNIFATVPINPYNYLIEWYASAAPTAPNEETRP
jgi:hypothetical protein